MKYGYFGKILRVNLSNGDIKTEELDISTAKKYVGGRGLGTKLMMDEVGAEVEPLSEENKLMFVTGPLTASRMPTGGRYMVVTKSPLSNTIASSNSGGRWGAEFKSTGHDVLIFEGKSEKPVYLLVEDDKVELKDASSIWGKTTSEMTEELQVEYPKHKIASIGPAGEKLSKMSAIINDMDRAAGRSGVGAVMGSKNLKAVVVKGSQKLQYRDDDKVKSIAMDKVRKLRENPVAGEGLPTYGTAVLVNIVNELGMLPVKNFQESHTERADEISGETLKEKHLVKNAACYGCPIACARVVKMPDGRIVGGPEYETIWGFGSDCNIYDLESINIANELCNEYGLDTISVSSTIACAMELKDRGYIKDEDIAADGLSLEWGDSKNIIGWVEKIGKREGFGDKMAEGSYRLAESYGVPELSMTVKKLEMPAYDPRGAKGEGINYMTSNRGGCHVRGYMISPEVLGQPEKLDRLSNEGKASYTKGFQDLTAVVDSLGICLFSTFGLGADDMVEMTNGIYGEDFFTKESLLETGDRIWNIEKLYNLKAGLTVEDDILPKRLAEESIVEGPSKGEGFDMEKLRAEYYIARGWDESGVPSKETLEKLDLGEYI